MKEKKQIRAPHVFVLILIMIVCATVLTYVLPAGTYNRYVDEATDTTLVEDGSYQQIEQTPVSIFGMLQAIPDGLIDAASIVSMVLVYGGAFGIINTTRVIEYGIASSIEKNEAFFGADHPGHHDSVLSDGLDAGCVGELLCIHPAVYHAGKGHGL